MDTELVEHRAKSKITFAIPLLIAVSIVSYMAFQINYLRQQLVKQGSQSLELKNSNDILERQLQAANLKLVALNTANNYLEKNTERLGAIKEFLQSQLNTINEKLVQQQEIISSLAEANSKLDKIILQKAKVNVRLSPAEEK